MKNEIKTFILRFSNDLVELFSHSVIFLFLFSGFPVFYIEFCVVNDVTSCCSPVQFFCSFLCFPALTVSGCSLLLCLFIINY